jgi:hypothetical protein
MLSNSIRSFSTGVGVLEKEKVSIMENPFFEGNSPPLPSGG